MKQELSRLFVLLVLLLSQVPASYAADCAPPGTVYRTGCPREVLESSTCTDCDIFAQPDPVCHVTKIENKAISWADHVDHLQVGGLLMESSAVFIPVINLEWSLLIIVGLNLIHLLLAQQAGHKR